ncbi:glycoside hydrolase superfamily [Sparassis latifolia]|uniref:Uncharacterized glycosyl hydrolase n=1 Tax=Sparassis crispa TaxID=139825 RepID=A0A401GKZ0_9APHY|nr:Uncharacterized glycosyl hydrolase [Sparassis crispa]GBE82841.1 Uncharacterized glycosyl hydrolase [Sparassis crispa]
MPQVPSVSPVTGEPVPPYFIHTTDRHFVDNAGRTLILRGVNLSGSDKAPVDRPSYILEDFWESGETGGESFVGRPLNLDDGSADIHLSRLRGWGFNMLRYVVTWEALEHAGPGKYDSAYMDYTVRVLRKCKEYGFKIYMDPHQDIWSRFSGGSGAPYWTLLACGLDPRHFTATQGAIVHCEYPTPIEVEPATLPPMIWSTNYGRLVSQTLFTLFFAGRDYAPKCIIDGENIQDYLQKHFISAFGALADRIRAAGDLLDECVLGWDSINEPYEGFCGYPDLNAVPTQQTSTLKKGTFPTPAQSMRLGMGQPQTVQNWTFGSMGPKRDGTVTIDPNGWKVWVDPDSEPGGVHPRWGWRRDPGWKLGMCIWAQHGIWDVESGFVMLPDYFRSSPCDPDHDVMFIEDYWRPHWQAFAARMRQSHPEAILFVAPPVFAPPPPITDDELRGRCCYSTHYYDGLTLVTRHWNWFNADALGLLRGKYSSKLPAVKIGESAIRKSLQQQLGILRDDALILGPYPTIIGEIGIPYDMDDKKSYGWTDDGKYKGDYSCQQKALDASLNAADGPNALSYSIWTYCPDHTHPWGDNWNMEDLSIWSPDDLRPRESIRMGMSAASSSKSLVTKSIKGVPIILTASAAPSSLSLATLPLETGAVDGETNNAEITSFGHWENAYDFLTDGARAVKAFCRPFPTAIVGVPKDIQFNVSKAEFKFTVCVRPEDAPRAEGLSAPKSSSSSMTSTAVDDDESEDVLATEIYVPLVHYGSDALVTRFTEQQCDDTSSTPVLDGPLAKDFGPYRSQNVSVSNLSDGTPSYLTPFAPSAAPLALSVHVSDGRWAVEGQTLKWWYGVPAPGAPEREYTITITRAGGVIKTAEETEPTQGLWAEWCSCLNGCTIM